MSLHQPVGQEQDLGLGNLSELHRHVIKPPYILRLTRRINIGSIFDSHPVIDVSLR